MAVTVAERSDDVQIPMKMLMFAARIFHSIWHAEGRQIGRFAASSIESYVDNLAQPSPKE